MSKKKQKGPKNEETSVVQINQNHSLDFSIREDGSLSRDKMSRNGIVSVSDTGRDTVSVSGSGNVEQISDKMPKSMSHGAASPVSPGFVASEKTLQTECENHSHTVMTVPMNVGNKTGEKSGEKYENRTIPSHDCDSNNDCIQCPIVPHENDLGKELERFQSLPSDFTIIPSPDKTNSDHFDYARETSGLPASYSLPNDYDMDIIERNPYDAMAMSHSGILDRGPTLPNVKRKNTTFPRTSDDAKKFVDDNTADNWFKGRVSATSSNGEEKSEKEGIKTKLISAWNNVRHGWTVKTKTAFKIGSPIWLLGKMYDIQSKEWEEDLRREKVTVPAFEEFRQDFSSRLWFTYRKGFDCFPRSDISTDTGWGCMIRSGQMLLAQGLLYHKLGRDWKWHKKQVGQQDIYHRHIVKFFLDSPSDECPLSVHNLVRIGKLHGKKVGDWYGPGSMAHVLREAIKEGAIFNPLLTDITVYVAQDCTIYKQDVIEVCTRRSRSTSRSNSPRSSPSSRAPFWKPLIIIVPVRLGTNSFNTTYTPCVQAILASDFCIGIIGGKPKHSLYFIGWQDDKLVYLDPHFCQSAVDSSLPLASLPLNSYHCMSPRKLSFSKMDPSCAIGFYCGTLQNFEKFCFELPKLISPPMDTGVYPMFVITEGSSADITSPASPKDTKVNSVDHRKRLRERTESKDSEDFVFL